LAYPTPRIAIEALTKSARAALQCVARTEVLASEFGSTTPGNLIVVSSENVPAGTLLLRRPERSPFLHLKLSIEYSVVQFLDAPAQLRYEAIVTMYLYAVRDLDGRELFAYHWHPVGLSSVHRPHMHVSSARPVALPARPGSTRAAEMVLSRIHFPTHHMELSDLIMFLITELGVGPRRPDWESVLDRIERSSR
jgi:hypothetical protein